MNWFDGTIPQAIGLAKTSNAIFLVYVYDKSEATKTTDATLAEEELATLLSSKKFVAIKLENGSESANQFSQIYPVVVLPSLYFISGSTGIPLEILGGAVSKDKLKEKLNQFTKVVEAASINSQTEQAQSAPEKMVVDEPHLPSSAAAAASTINPEMPAVDQNSSAAPTSPGNTFPLPEIPEDLSSGEKDITDDISDDGENEEKETEADVEEKVGRAKVLLSEKQAKEDENKKEDDKKNELERRKMGQEIAKRKRQMYEEEVQSAARERKKEKDDDRAARDRVRAQIAADRLERETKRALLQEAAPPAQDSSPNAPQPGASAANRNATITRLKFRLPDGSSSIAQFPVEATLAEVRQHVQQQLVSASSFSLTSTVHHRPFTSQENNVSLSDLGLVPSAIVVVLLNSYTSASGSMVPSQGGIMQFLWLLLSPITFILGFIRRIFSSGSSSTPPSSNRSTQGGSSQVTTQRPSTSYGRHRENRGTRERIIHRLHNSNDDDDDDNNTWNGNSTQQM